MFKKSSVLSVGIAALGLSTITSTMYQGTHSQQTFIATYAPTAAASSSIQQKTYALEQAHRNASQPPRVPLHRPVGQQSGQPKK